MELKHLGRDTYSYILRMLAAEDLLRLAQTDRQNNQGSSTDMVWKHVFERDFGSQTVYDAEKEITVVANFKSAYRQFKKILPIVQSKDVYELCRNMIQFSNLFSKPPVEFKSQYRHVWYQSSKNGDEITRQNGVRSTYKKVRDRTDNGHDKDSTNNENDPNVRAIKRQNTLPLSRCETKIFEQTDLASLLRASK